VGRTRDPIAAGVHRLGSPLVNFYLVEENGRYSLVDAGLPAHFDVLLAHLRDHDIDPHDIDAVVLTHAHGDHVGIAERVRTEAQARVLVHGADAQMARTAKQRLGNTGAFVRQLWRPTAWRLIAHLTRGGGLKVKRIEDLHTFRDGDVLDVPGHPTVVATPGHSHGHSVLLLEDRGVLFTGDALCSRNPLTGRTGPQVMPTAFNASTEQALASLDRIAALEADTLLFGHGEPWREGAASAVERARELGPS
jgi:glyoxylase-like metal-dependent hydrolase (beta-lactamase superfamily II)